MKLVLILLLMGFILILWYLSNIFNKPVLNRMHNYYEDDAVGRQIANVIMVIIIVLSLFIGYLL